MIRRLGDTLIRRIVPPPRGDDIVEDLRQEYDVYQRPERGPVVATAWYVWQVFSTLAASPRLRRSGSPVTSPRGSMLFGDDFRYAARALRRSPSFTLAVVVTLAIGIGVNVAVFSVVSAVLIRPLPYPQADRLVAVTYPATDPAHSGMAVPLPALHAWIEPSRTIDVFAPYTFGETIVATPSWQQLHVRRASVSPRFLPLLGIPYMPTGRSFQAADFAPVAPAAVILGHQFWQQHFGGDPAIVGRAIRLQGRPAEVIGIAPASLRFPGHLNPDVLTPLAIPPEETVVRFVSVIGRLRAGETSASAERELQHLTTAAEPSFSGDMRKIADMAAGPRVVPLQEHIAGDLTKTLAVTLGAVGLILLIAVTNVTSLLLARIATREREFATCMALGATPLRLARRTLAECILLAGLAGTGALAGLYGSLNTMHRVLSGTTPHAYSINIDIRVLGFACLLVAGTAVLCALWPTWRMRTSQISPRTRSGSSDASRAGLGPVARGGLIGGQVALATLLLIGSLLLLNTLMRLTGPGLGFEPGRTLTFKVPAFSMRESTLGRPEQIEEILARIRRLPMVQAAGASTVFPLGGHSFRFTIPVEGEPPPVQDAREGPSVDVVSPGYFGSLGIRVIAGRDFTERDSAAATEVAIVNQAFVDAVLGGRDPLGKRIGLGGIPEDARIVIVGVVENFRDAAPAGITRPAVYRAFAQPTPQYGWHTVAFTVRTSSAPMAAAEPVRKEVLAVAPGAAIYDVRTMEDRLASSVASESQRAALFGFFAAAAVLLTAFGVYGLLSYAVSRDMHELGVRRALGSSERGIVVLVLRRGLVPAAIGVILGLSGAFAFTGVLSSFLYEVSPTDPLTYGIAAAAMLALSAVAALSPAHRAASADPLTVLRGE